MKRWLWRLFAALVLAALAAAAGAGAWAWRTVHRPHRAAQGEQLVTVEPGTSARRILERLADDGLLHDALLARLYLVYLMGDPPLLAGEYRFDGPLSTPEVLEKLTRGDVVTYPAKVIEGLTLEEAAESLATQGFGSAETFRLEMLRGDLVADLDPEAATLEGYLYPDTYHFARGTRESDIVATLVRTFRRRFADEVEPLSPKRGIRELVTLAAIVEKEAQVADEREVIASVYANRLRIGMPLQADPTVIFAKMRLGTWDGNLRRPDLKLDEPYNTYVYPGLPPGPICSPGVASLRAAARPAETEFLYFVSRNDGTHVFAKSLREHNRNVHVWQKQYWRKRWAAERRGE